MSNITPDLKHTPGPWIIGQGESNCTEHDHWGTVKTTAYTGDLHVVTVWADTPELSKEAEANARLIAAAPDLLDLAKQYARECGDCDGTGMRRRIDHEGTPIEDIPCEECADIRAVIAKAEG